MTSLAHGTDRKESDSSAADPIDVVTRAQAAVMTMTERVDHPHRGMTSRLAVVMRDVVRMVRKYGANEPEARAVPLAIDGVIADLFHPLADERTVLRMESDADRKEDALQDMIAIEGGSPPLWDARARALREQAATSLAAARLFDEMSRQARTTQAVARQRLNVGGN